MTHRLAGGAYQILGALLIFTTIACGPTTPADQNNQQDAGNTDANPPVVEVSISPDAPSLKKGGTQQFTATVKGADNTAVTWSVQEDNGGSITADGLYTAPLATGTFHVVATSVADAEASATVAIEVTALQLAIQPATAAITSAKTQQFTATIDGAASTEVNWSVKEDGGGTITADGLYTPPLVNEQSTFHVVAATKEDPSVTVERAITVTPFVFTTSPAQATLDAGATQQFTAAIDGTTTTDVTWAIVDEDGQEITTGGLIDEDGLYTAPIPPGTVYVKATSTLDSSRFAVATITVNEIVVTLSPETATLQPGATEQFTATVTGAATKDVAWSATGGTITETGLFTAPYVAGTYTVEAVSTVDEQVKATASVTVNPIVVAITTDTSMALEPGDTLQLLATVTGGRPVAWVITDEAGTELTDGGTITQDGLYTAPWVGGEYWIHAVSTDDARSSHAVKVTVNPIAVAVSPDAPTLDAGATQQFTSTVTGGRPVVWSATGGTITQEGLFTAPWVGGEYWIRATSTDDARSSHAVQVTVSQITVDVSPKTTTLEAGETQQFTATVTGNRAVQWSATGGTITQNGLFTAPWVGGEYTIKATSTDDARSSHSVTVTVNQPAIAVLPEAPTLAAGATQQFTATITGAATQDVEWSATGGTITQDGLYTAPWVGGEYTVTATSTDDESISHSVKVTVNQISVAVSPSAPALAAGATQQFTATVTGDRSVDWSATGGTIDENGLFTAPWVGGEYTITATSTDDARSSHSVTVTVSKLAITLAPGTAALNGGTTQQFTATVTPNRPVVWSASAGSITQAGLFTAPTAGGTVTVTATSADDSSVKATATVTVTEAPLMVSLVAGAITENAGIGSSGSNNGTGSVARFSTPSGIARLSETELLVADEGNSCIRHVTTAGVVTTFAGVCGSKSSVDGPATTTARFSSPHGITVMPDRTVWVAEATNPPATPKLRRIREVNTVWTVDTPTLQYDSALVRLDYFHGIEQTANGTLLVINRNRGNVLEVSGLSGSTLQVSVFAGPSQQVLDANRFGATNGTCEEARFSNGLRDVAVLNGKVYVSDFPNHCVRVIERGQDGTCQVSTAVGQCGTEGRQDATPATQAKIRQPFGLAVGPDQRLYISEYGNNVVSVYDPGDETNDSVLMKIAGTGVSGFAEGAALTAAKFNAPGNITVANDGTAYITERFGNRVRRIGR